LRERARARGTQREGTREREREREGERNTAGFLIHGWHAQDFLLS